MILKHYFLLKQHVAKRKFCKSRGGQDSHLAMTLPNDFGRGPDTSHPWNLPLRLWQKIDGFTHQQPRLILGLTLTSNVALCGSLNLSGLLFLYLQTYEAGHARPSLPQFSDRTHELVTRIPKLKPIQCCVQFGMH